jgi:hypothetical protein
MEYADSVGSKSIELAIWDGRSVEGFAGLADTDAYVSEFSVLGSQQIDQLEMYGGVFTVTVRTRGA